MHEGRQNMSRRGSRSCTDRLIAHVVSLRFENLSPRAIAAAQTFVLDSLGVALSGSRVPMVGTLRAVARRWGAGDGARVWVSGERLPAPSAAFLNGYQIHNQEWDCVHEPAVVHPMAVVLATLMAHAEERGSVDGRKLILGCVAAVDVAATIGAAARSPLRFFRPAICGALGATAGLAAIEGLDADTLRSALGLCYSQASGTMQAHVEGSPMLPIQIGFNARAALAALDMANRGIRGPLDFLEGPFGYYALIDPEWSPLPFEELGGLSRICELSHKPFPSGRATHGGVDGVLTLQSQHHFTSEEVREIRVIAPPLIVQLVDRAPRADMAPPYARLCLPYVAATALQRGGVDVSDFDPPALRDADRLRLAQRIRVVRDDNPSPNALAPQRVEIDLADGRQLAIDLPQVLGAPLRPLSRERQLGKFRRAAASAARSFDTLAIERLISLCERLPELSDVRTLVDAMVSPEPSA
jgi:2-methylcitrate dehydratase PrpD